VNHLKKIISGLAIMTTIVSAQNLISPSDPNIQYFGRVDRSVTGKVMFDWPGILIQANFNGTSCAAVLEGINCFDVYIDGVLEKNFKVTKEKAAWELVKRLTDRTHRLLIVKRSESASSPSSFYGLLLDKDRTLASLPPPPQRKIEFIGDSYTVGFANEYLNQASPLGKEDSIILAATNTYKAFGPILSRAFNAQYQVIAVSGKGLVRNYNGIDKGRELPALYDRTLVSSTNGGASGKWDFSSWKADVVVIGLGINDFQAEPPYADSATFDADYAKLIDRIRKQYPGVKIVCCATKVWPTDLLKPHVKAIAEKQKVQGHTDIRYFEYVSENGALYGHPHLYDHQAIAELLIPVISELTGWRRTDTMRGK
jgi:lysophospholipase L1-like esterase